MPGKYHKVYPGYQRFSREELQLAARRKERERERERPLFKLGVSINITIVLQESRMIRN